jgi:5-carboxymethyl-2-hydroxymuconate isomerase
MPHLTLEYSASLASKFGHRELFRQLHNTLADMVGIRLANCKSRAYPATDAMVGDGDTDAVFVHLDVRFLAGRSDELRQSVGTEMRQTLLDWFAPKAGSADLQVTVEVRDIDRAFYFKHPEATLSQP